jgi:hypothetical protein
MLMVLDLLNTAQHFCSAMPDQTAPGAQHLCSSMPDQTAPDAQIAPCPPESTPGKQLVNIMH